MSAEVAPSRSIEHPAQPDAINHAAMHAKAYDATGALVHHDDHPMGAQDGRFASKQIETPETVFRVPRTVSQDGPAASGRPCTAQRGCAAPRPC
jgi:hypothetical protein